MTILDLSRTEFADMVKAWAGGVPSDEQLVAYEAKATEIAEFEAKIVRAKAATDKLSLLDDSGSEGVAVKGETLGERYISTKAYEDFSSANNGMAPTGNISLKSQRVGSMNDFFASRKADTLTTEIAHPAAVRLPMIDQVVRPQLTLLDLISRGKIGSASIEYLQVIGINRAAALQPENTGKVTDTLKPLSDFATNLETAKVFGYADGYTVTNQLLADGPALASYLNGEMKYSLDTIIQRYLLHGTGTNGEPKGIFNTTGIQDLTYTGTDDLALSEAVYRAITAVAKVGGSTTAILINPIDEEKIQLSKDGNGQYRGGGPFGLAPMTLWGRPRVVSDAVDEGTAIVGDFKQIALLDREGLNVLAFNQHEDFARRNLVYVRAELRAAQAIWRPNRLAIVSKGA